MSNEILCFGCEKNAPELGPIDPFSGCHELCYKCVKCNKIADPELGPIDWFTDSHERCLECIICGKNGDTENELGFVDRISKCHRGCLKIEPKKPVRMNLLKSSLLPFFKRQPVEEDICC